MKGRRPAGRARLVLAWALAGLFAGGCGGQEKEPAADRPAEKTSQPAIVIRERAWKDPECAAAPAECAHVAFRYVEMVDGPAPVRSALNAFVRRELLKPVFGDEEAAGLEGAADEFLGRYGEFRRRFPDSEQVWWLRREIRLVEAPVGVYSLAAETDMYTGGAHGIETTTLQTLDRENERWLTLEDLFVDGFREELTAIGERCFRELVAIEADSSLSSAGFLFDDDRFVLCGNFAVRNDGLLFHWNPYEIAPYALGPTDLLLPLGEIEHLLKPGGPWGK